MTIVIPAGAGGFGYTAQEMSDQVADELRNTTISAKILRWLNMAITELSTEYIFGLLHKYSSKSTAPGIPDLILDADVLWLKSVEIPAQNKKIYPLEMGEAQWAEQQPNYRSLQGTITNYYINGITLGFVMVPSDIFSVNYSYQKRASKLVGSTDVCDLPPEWHLIVIQRAVTIGCRYEGSDSLLAASMAREKELIRGLGQNVYRRPDQTTVLGGKGRRGWPGKPGYPRLPSNYPKGS